MSDKPAILMVLEGVCPKCGGSLDTGYECNSCDFDGLLLVRCREAAEARGERMHPSGLYESEFAPAPAMSTGTAKTPKAVEGRSPASAVPEGQAPNPNGETTNETV